MVNRADNLQGAMTHEDEVEILRLENQELKNEIKALRDKFNSLEALADTDTLTPLANRRCFVRELDRVIRHVARYNSSAAVLFIDVDGLKNINDGFGHCAGDQALIHVAQLLRSTLRSTDVVARIGGDEFGLLVDPIEEQAVLRKIGALTKLISNSMIDYKGKSLLVNISIGSTMIRVDDDVDAVLSRADSAMYGVKRSQRSLR